MASSVKNIAWFASAFVLASWSLPAFADMQSDQAACAEGFKAMAAGGSNANGIDQLAACDRVKLASFELQLISKVQRFKLLMAAGRKSEALPLLETLAMNPWFEFDGLWSKNPEAVRQYQATGATRYGILQTLAVEYLNAGDANKALLWVERLIRLAEGDNAPEIGYKKKIHFMDYVVNEFVVPRLDEAGCAYVLRAQIMNKMGDASQYGQDIARAGARNCQQYNAPSLIAANFEGNNLAIIEKLRGDYTNANAAIQQKAEQLKAFKTERMKGRIALIDKASKLPADSAEKKQAQAEQERYVRESEAQQKTMQQAITALRDAYLAKESTSFGGPPQFKTPASNPWPVDGNANW